MKLYWSSRSPFVRKVMIVAHEVGLAHRIETIRTIVSPVKPNPEVMALNPLNKLPTLILDDGRVLYDSRVICEYLDGLGEHPKLFPPGGPQRLEALRRQALGDGILDFLLLGLSERQRPEARQSSELKDALDVKFRCAFDALEREAADLARGPLTIGHIAIGCALGYADFRYQDQDWRKGRPQLAAFDRWLKSRPSFTATEHVDVY